MGAEAALVVCSAVGRMPCVPLYGVLRPGDELLGVSGTVRHPRGGHWAPRPTDDNMRGTLADFGVTSSGARRIGRSRRPRRATFDLEAIEAAMSPAAHAPRAALLRLLVATVDLRRRDRRLASG